MKKGFLSFFLSFFLVNFLLISVDPVSLAYAQEEEETLDSVQMNSLTMLNYLMVTTRDISESGHSRVHLEEVYNSLVNNIYPNAVDPQTQEQLLTMLDILDSQRMISIYRDRAYYLYDQRKAEAIKAALITPIDLLPETNTDDPIEKGLAISTIVAKSVVSYWEVIEEKETELMTSNWDLDDAELEQIQSNRKSAFSYMLNMVRDYDLPGDLALSEAAVDEFVSWKNNTNLNQRIRFLESNQKTYKAYSYYWLLLAESYYGVERYQDCLDAVNTYLDMNVRIFRKDFELAKVLPMATEAAAQVLSDEEYIETAEKFAELILENTGNSDWALRYYAAEIYIDLYTRENDRNYLQQAYEIILDNVNYLVVEQKDENRTYLAAVKKVEAKHDATKAEKDDIKAYNKMLTEARKTELAPVYEPLLLNVDLLYALMDELEVSDQTRESVRRILGSGEDHVFLVDPLNDLYMLDEDPATYIDISLTWTATKTTLSIPARYLCADSVIKVTVTDGNTSTVYEDWTIDTVNRKNPNDYDSFYAVFSSKTIQRQKYSKDSKVIIEVSVKEEYIPNVLTFEYEVANTSDVLSVQLNVEFRRVK